MLASISIILCMFITQVAPAYADVDGQLYKTIVSGAPMKMFNSSGSPTLMTTGLGEALAHRGASTNGYEYYMGQSSVKGTLYGYVLDRQVTIPNSMAPIQPNILNVYYDESETGWGDTVDFYDMINSNHRYETHKEMQLIQVTDYVDNTGYTHTCFGYIHGNFRSGNSNAYWVSMY